ncbi:MAG: helix-turn-helix transcriptional regulator [Oscillospiraceae bacterium]|nr:helix-turn-helix transcriptional regulator [Oscillospiraceae bacterium]
MSQNEIIAKRLSELRKEKGVKQDEIAKLLNVERATVANYETGKRAPNYETIIKLADYYGVSCDYILRGVKSEFAEFNSTTGLMQEAIDELEREKNISETQKKYSNYLKITNGFIESRVLLDLTLYITEFEKCLKEKNKLINMRLKTYDDTNADSEIFDEKDFNNSLEEIQGKIDLCLFRLQKLITEFAESYCYEYIEEITMSKNDMIEYQNDIIKEVSGIFDNSFNKVSISDLIQNVLKNMKGGDTDVNNPKTK